MKLLPNVYKKWGWIFLIIGCVFALIYLTGKIRIETPVFALYSGFMENKFFSMTHTNLSDELAIVFLFAGITILSLSSEVYESERIRKIRYNALLYTITLNSLLIVLLTLLIYGSGYGYVLIVGLLSHPLIYLSAFNILKRKNQNRR